MRTYFNPEVFVQNRKSNEPDLEKYTSLVRLVEKMHRQLLDVIKYEIEKSDLKNINPVQVLLLYNIGDSELTVGELRLRGHYLGTNASYNLRKLTHSGYLVQQKAEHDRRSVCVALTEKGRSVKKCFDKLFAGHVESLRPIASVDALMLENCEETLSRIKKMWVDQVEYML